MSEQKPERLRILRDHAGAFAIAFALFFGAGAFGFNSSPAFAMLFITLVGCIVVLTLSFIVAANSDRSDWLATGIIGVLWLATFITLYAGVGESYRLLHKAAESATAPGNSNAP